MSNMIGWTVRKPDGWTVDTIYYTEDCDEQYIRSAEEIPHCYTMENDA